MRNLQFVIHLTQISDEELYLFVVICTAKTHEVSDYAVTLLSCFVLCVECDNLRKIHSVCGTVYDVCAVISECGTCLVSH